MSVNYSLKGVIVLYNESPHCTVSIGCQDCHAGGMVAPAKVVPRWLFLGGGSASASCDRLWREGLLPHIHTLKESPLLV